MVYIYLSENSLKLVSLSKTMLGQYTVNFFEKIHINKLIEDGRVKDIDLVASAIKEALGGAKPEPITDRDVVLILPQESFNFARYSVPSDISDSATLAFVKDKVRTDVRFDLENSRFDYSISHKTKESTVLLLAQKNDVFDDFAGVCKLLQLSIKHVVPETMAYYKLFEKALREDKKETLLYAYMEGPNSYAYLFDYLGLLKEKKYLFDEGDPSSLKKIVEEITAENITLNRLILSGAGSSKIRQDLFTKEVGVWTNPLEKIIQNFYTHYLKIIVPGDSSFPLLHFDVCLGAFIFAQENTSFSLLKEGSRLTKKKGVSLPSISLPNLGISKKGVFIFIITLLLTVAAIVAVVKFGPGVKTNLIPKTQPTVAPKPTSEPTAKPELDRSEVNIKILNGTGTAGVAGKMRDILIEAGYTEVLTDNADTFDFTQTKIAVKDDKKTYGQLLIKDLIDVVAIEKVDISSLNKTDAADIVLTIGSDFE